ncbi:MAG: hypothetical protein HQL97_04105 [Magnetococcales bacterium]|nr:hypothetical protein [Magnetococcales bacterium]MBF0261014.1 hypothetical protein [Magnetococcales bacterium]
MTITLSEQAASIVRSFLPSFDSPEAFVEEAIREMVDRTLQTALEENDDPVWIETLRQSLAECGREPLIPLDLPSLKQALRREMDVERIGLT